jgi:hypothetical protein
MANKDKLKRKILEEIKWLLENDWYSRKFNKVSAQMVYSRIYKTKQIKYASKRWKNFLNLWKEMFKDSYLSEDQWGQPVILHDVKELISYKS